MNKIIIGLLVSSVAATAAIADTKIGQVMVDYSSEAKKVSLNDGSANQRMKDLNNLDVDLNSMKVINHEISELRATYKDLKDLKNESYSNYLNVKNQMGVKSSQAKMAYSEYKLAKKAYAKAYRSKLFPLIALDAKLISSSATFAKALVADYKAFWDNSDIVGIQAADKKLISNLSETYEAVKSYNAINIVNSINNIEDDFNTIHELRMNFLNDGLSTSSEPEFTESQAAEMINNSESFNHFMDRITVQSIAKIKHVDYKKASELYAQSNQNVVDLFVSTMDGFNQFTQQDAIVKMFEAVSSGTAKQQVIDALNNISNSNIVAEGYNLNDLVVDYVNQKFTDPVVKNAIIALTKTLKVFDLHESLEVLRTVNTDESSVDLSSYDVISKAANNNVFAKLMVVLTSGVKSQVNSSNLDISVTDQQAYEMLLIAIGSQVKINS